MKPDTLNIEIPAGATYKQSLLWKDSNGALVNLTGYAARMMVKRTVTSSAIISISNVSNSQGVITLGGAAGTIDITVNAAHTTTLTAGKYLWAIELESGGGEVTRLLDGEAVVTAEVVK